MIEQPSPNFGTRAAETPIDMLVLHYTGMLDAQAALDRLCDRESKVSAHYLIDEGGSAYCLVDEQQRAWHAGVSFWRGETDINSRSIGIELVNPGHEHGYRPFPEAQMKAVIALSEEILARHPIPPRNVVGHSDIAPDRKQDPGELFDWQRLARAGIGLWPELATVGAPSNFAEQAAAYGYNTSTEHYIAAFQRHFRPSLIDGGIDDDTIGQMAGLLSLIKV